MVPLTKAQTTTLIDTAVSQIEAYFDGRIDDLRVYNRALSAAEIKTARTTALA